MKIAFLAAALASILTACSPVQEAERSEAEIAGNRGLPRSAAAPSFMPLHLTGSNAGKKVCPLCVFGLVPQIQIWAEESHLESALGLAKKIDEALAAGRAPAGTVAYVIVAASQGGNLNGASMDRVRGAGLRKAFVTSIPNWTDAETGKLYGNSNSERPGIRAYAVINRRVYQRWEKPTPSQAPVMLKAIGEGARYVTTHDIADSTIAPPWEPGQRLEVRFRVLDNQGRPLVNTKVSASQTDRTGRYNPQGWGRMAPTLSTLAWTDRDGWITWRTIMPGPYPTRTEPAHIHFTATVNGRPQWRSLWFEGDPLLSAEKRAWADRDAETEVVQIDKSLPVWKVTHTFRVR